MSDYKITHTGTIKVLGKEMKFELYGETAPKTVENFVKLINDKFYDGIIFHRVIPGFMIQGGDPTGTGMGGSKEEIYGEFKSNGFDNPIKHVKGVMSMARTMMPNSASSQIFIMHEVSPHLDGQYAAFGKVVSGLDVIDTIANTKRDRSDKPLEDIVIESVRLD